MKTLPDRLRIAAAATPESAGLLREAADHIEALRQRIDALDEEDETAHLLGPEPNRRRLLASIQQIEGSCDVTGPAKV